MCLCIIVLLYVGSPTSQLKCFERFGKVWIVIVMYIYHTIPPHMVTFAGTRQKFEQETLVKPRNTSVYIYLGIYMYVCTLCS